MKPVITVVTTTYNRASCLQKLFTSLLQQKDNKFIWMIIDDGSTDKTQECVSGWQTVAPFKIQYFKKENGGKHIALNFAYQYVITPLTFIVDSDDWLTTDAIEMVKNDFKKYCDDKELCGFSYLRGKPEGGILSSSSVLIDGEKESFCNYRINRNISGDMAEVWYTHCLKEYPFPEFEGEKFLGEDVVWIKMSEKYKLRFFNKIIYISQYLQEGLTKRRRWHNVHSPNGCVLRAETFLNANIRFRYKVKAMMQYIIYGKFAGNLYLNMLKKSRYKILFVVVILPSTFLYIIWRKIYRCKIAAK